jgi:TnpA family transposase
MPRIKRISVQKLYRVEDGDTDSYPNLKPVLSHRCINWELIIQQYDEMVKYATALRLGTASAESILRRFTRNNTQHPTYKALAELGKVVKTIFLCRYLASRDLRRQIHEGLNVVEHWNGANDFLFFARQGQMMSNQKDDHEISMLCLHLLQNSMVYINTLMIERILARSEWQGKLNERDLKALTPLMRDHVNPYGRFELDMNTRLLVDP